MSTVPTFPPLDSTLGAVAIGAIVSTFLFGIGTLQTYHYFNKYTEDSTLLRSAVAIVWLLELGHMIATWHLIYVVGITFYGQIQHLEVPPHSLDMVVFFLACVILTVQCFFANRVRLLSRKWLIPVICWTMTALRVILILAMMGFQWVQPNIETIQVKFRWLMTTSLSLGMAVDTVITLSMCYWLWQIRPSRFQETKRMVDVLLVWTVETGVATCVTGGMFLIFFLSRHDLTWFPFFLVQAKLYSNSLLVSLNDRKCLRGSGNVLEISVRPTTHGQGVPEGNRGLVIEMSKRVETNGNMSKDLEHGGDAELMGVKHMDLL
ncbi:hypothetical protein C8R45DRAFT_1096324 [Mycena sanguinolenta]|nr:hypothetical protein C8R45DRAFT_1096324 [Mycena sanguinolenta]